MLTPLLLAVTALTPVGTPAQRPNIVIILADDLGYGDPSCNNPDRGKIKTPFIDKIAAQGMRFTDAHASSAVCTPSRYTLLTGRYHWRTRLQSGIVARWEKPLIAPDRLTIAGLLKAKNYHSSCIGKWHLGWHWQIDPKDGKFFFGYPGTSTSKAPKLTPAHVEKWQEVFSKPILGGPTTRGFDEYFGTDVPNWPPFAFIENDRTLGIPTEFLPVEKTRGLLASSHGPALPGWDQVAILPTLTDRACKYIQKRAATKQPFFLYMPLTSPHTPIAVSKEFQGKSGLKSPVADYIVETDVMVGRVLDAIDKSGVADNTLVIFTSDNGFAPYVGVRELEKQGHFPSGPLRGYKADAWEGGHRIPFMLRWPGVVKPGSVCKQLIHHADLLATFAEITGLKVPENMGEDSVSILSLLKGGTKPVREHAVSQSSNGVMALRNKEWKIIFAPGGGGHWSSYSAEPKATTAGQLYRLDDDIAERKNLFAERTDIVAELTAVMEKTVTDGRSTPGKALKNDVAVKWKRFLVAPKPATPKSSK